MTNSQESAELGPKTVINLEPKPLTEEGSQGIIELVGDVGLDILDDDIDEVLNTLGDIDVDPDDFEDGLASFDYMSI